MIRVWGWIIQDGEVWDEESTKETPMISMG
jgi:hypothetical protein